MFLLISLVSKIKLNFSHKKRLKCAPIVCWQQRSCGTNIFKIYSQEYRKVCAVFYLATVPYVNVAYFWKLHFYVVISKKLFLLIIYYILTLKNQVGLNRETELAIQWSSAGHLFHKKNMFECCVQNPTF